MTDETRGDESTATIARPIPTGPLVDAPHDVRILERTPVHRGYVWDLTSERFAYGEDVITREFVDHTGAVAVLALDDEGRALVIGQYRHPVRTRDWELPAGLLDVAGESALDAAARELAEEADLQASEWNVLLDVFPSPGGSSESIRIFLARGLRPTGSTFARTHEEADIELRWIALDELVAAILTGGLHNGTMITGVLAAARLRDAGWAGLLPADAPWPTRPAGPDRMRGNA